MKKIKIGYFGDGPWSHQALEKLLDDKTLEVKFVCARNDRPDTVLKAKAEEKVNKMAKDQMKKQVKKKLFRK